MMLKADVTTMKTLTVANADVAEFVVKEGSRITHKQVKDLDLPSTVTLGGLVRNGKGTLIMVTHTFKQATPWWLSVWKTP